MQGDHAPVRVAAADDPRRRTDERRVYRVATRQRREYARERERERGRESARERYVGVREKSRLVKPLSEKPAWLLDRPALRSVLHCAPCEAELSRYLLALPLARCDPRGIDPSIAGSRASARKSFARKSRRDKATES